MEDFYLYKGGPLRIRVCNVCMRARAKRYRDTKPEEIRLTKKRDAIKRKYGLTLDQYHALWESQDRKCAICRVPVDLYVTSTHIDHDHASHRVRGILCQGCNLGLGAFRENPKALAAAIAYLRSAP